MGGVVQVLYNSNITDDKLEVQDLRFQDSMEATSFSAAFLLAILSAGSDGDCYDSNALY
jgi:hypothetical protein